MVSVHGLPALSENQIYQLWAIAEGQAPVPAGLLTVNTTGSGSLNFKDLPENLSIAQFAVTLEPAGGVPAPTGAMHLAGTL